MCDELLLTMMYNISLLFFGMFDTMVDRTCVLWPLHFTVVWILCFVSSMNECPDLEYV
jgi:hypothetical protein